MLFISLIIIVIFIIGVLLVDFLIRKKQNESFNKNTDTIVIDENTTEIENSNFSYRNQVLLSLYLFLGYYGVNFIVATIAQVFLQNQAIKDLAIIDPEVLIETSTKYNEEITNHFLTYVSSYLYLVIYICMLVITVVIAKKIIKIDLLDAKKRIGKIMALMGIGVGCMYGVNIIVNIVTTIIGDNIVSTNQNNLIDVFNLGGEARFFLIIYTIICAPIVEELVFRKALFGFFRKNTIKAVIISSIIFALIHVISPCFIALTNIFNGKGTPLALLIELLYIFIYLPQAFVLAFIYYKAERNIVPVVIMHTINNALSVIGLFLVPYLN